MKNKIEKYFISLILAFPLLIVFIFVIIFEQVEHKKFSFTTNCYRDLYDFIAKSAQIGDSL